MVYSNYSEDDKHHIYCNVVFLSLFPLPCLTRGCWNDPYTTLTGVVCLCPLLMYIILPSRGGAVRQQQEWRMRGRVRRNVGK